MDALTHLSHPRVAIVGGGFGGLAVAQTLGNTAARVTLVDRHNYHLFQPLLYQVATGGLSPANIASPLRSLLRRYQNCETLMAEVVDFDIDRQRLILADGDLPYDILVVAAGAVTNHFGHQDWAIYAPGLKTVDDATRIRRQIYLAFEAAERESDPQVRAQWLHFLIVGGGPTGVELAGAITDIAAHTLKHDFRHIRPEDARVTIVNADSSVLHGYPGTLPQRATQILRGMRVEVISDARVTNISRDSVTLTHSDHSESTIPCKTAIWGAGVRANPLADRLANALGVSQSHGGKIKVDSMLRPANQSHLFVIGDMAECYDAEHNPLPGLAAVAKQQGHYVGQTIRLLMANQPVAPFDYRHRGTMATLGRGQAVADLNGTQFSGKLAWLLWLVVHLLLLVQFQNRVMVALQWAWNYLTFSRSARLITGETHVLRGTSHADAVGKGPNVEREEGHGPHDAASAETDLDAKS